MTFIKTIPPGKAIGEVAEVYNYMAEVSGRGMVAKIVQIFSLRPASMRRMIRQWELTTKEMIDRLRQKGYDDTGILDLAIAVADANMWARIYRLFGLDAGLYLHG